MTPCLPRGQTEAGSVFDGCPRVRGVSVSAAGGVRSICDQSVPSCPPAPHRLPPVHLPCLHPAPHPPPLLREAPTHPSTPAAVGPRAAIPPPQRPADVSAQPAAARRTLLRRHRPAADSGAPGRAAGGYARGHIKRTHAVLAGCSRICSASTARPCRTSPAGSEGGGGGCWGEKG